MTDEKKGKSGSTQFAHRAAGACFCCASITGREIEDDTHIAAAIARPADACHVLMIINIPFAE